MSADNFAEGLGQYLNYAQSGAYHEAAHAVVALTLGIGVLSIDMRRGEVQAMTFIRHRGLQWSSVLCVDLAGYFAEKRIGAPRAERLVGCGGDLADMRKTLAKVKGARLQIVKQCARDTLRILDENWHAVEALAELCLNAADDDRIVWLHASSLPELYAVLGGLPQGEKPIRRRRATIERYAAAYRSAIL